MNELHPAKVESGAGLQVRAEAHTSRAPGTGHVFSLSYVHTDQANTQ